MTVTALSNFDEDKNTDNQTLSVPRPRKTVENKDFAAFTRRIIRAHAKRVAQGDIEALTDLVALSALINDAIGQAVEGLREFGYSWTEIGRSVGMTKQAARQRWGTAVNSTPATRKHLDQDCLPGFDQIHQDGDGA